MKNLVLLSQVCIIVCVCGGGGGGGEGGLVVAGAFKGVAANGSWTIWVALMKASESGEYWGSSYPPPPSPSAL